MKYDVMSNNILSFMVNNYFTIINYLIFNMLLNYDSLFKE